MMCSKSEIETLIFTPLMFIMMALWVSTRGTIHLAPTIHSSFSMLPSVPPSWLLLGVRGAGICGDNIVLSQWSGHMMTWLTCAGLRFPGVGHRTLNGGISTFNIRQMHNSKISRGFSRNYTSTYYALMKYILCTKYIHQHIRKPHFNQISRGMRI